LPGPYDSGLLPRHVAKTPRNSTTRTRCPTTEALPSPAQPARRSPSGSDPLRLIAHSQACPAQSLPQNSIRSPLAPHQPSVSPFDWRISVPGPLRFPWLAVDAKRDRRDGSADHGTSRKVNPAGSAAEIDPVSRGVAGEAGRLSPQVFGEVARATQPGRSGLATEGPVVRRQNADRHGETEVGGLTAVRRGS
jgi:hypothetical protein